MRPWSAIQDILVMRHRKRIINRSKSCGIASQQGTDHFIPRYPGSKHAESLDSNRQR